MKTILSAAWAAPLPEAPIRDGAVVFDGEKLFKWGKAKDLAAEHPDAQRIGRDAAVILPGLINAHTHLELSSCACGDSPSSFVDWILSMPRRIGREPNQQADELFATSTRLGIEQCLRFGVTNVNDISQQMHVTRPILRDSPLTATSYGEVIGLGKRRSRFEELLPMAIDQSLRTRKLHIGLSPHSPYTLEPEAIRRCKRIGLAMTIHLAETPYEREFLNSHTGPLREMWERLGSWEDFPETFPGSPVEFADACGLLGYGTLLAHVNYCDDADLDLMQRRGASVAYCPRTHRYFGHPPHRWREMLARGIRVVVGTDSCASSPDLNLVDDLRLLYEIDPAFPVNRLWEMAVCGIAASRADFVIFDVNTADPLREILEADRRPREVWAGGQRVRHTHPASPC
jgi:cytosine/adenosine deaminase-related metal-dependent hydrolase